MISKILIYLSFLSLPNASEIGFLFLTQSYIALALISPLAAWMARPRVTFTRSTVSTFVFILFLSMFAIANFLISKINEIDSSTWLSRSVHLWLLPSILLTAAIERADATCLFKHLSVVGFIEVATIYFAAAFYPNELDSAQRAADIDGIIIYSICSACSAYYCVVRFNSTSNGKWLGFYCLILLASILTGTRVFIVSILLIGMAARISRRTLATVFLALLAVGLFSSLDQLQRFDLGQETNITTVSAKIEEIEWLGLLFLESPLIGVGFGKAYQVSLANSEYTYSHNMIMFYLAYGGLLGAVVAMYPIFRLFGSGHRIFVMAILLFYTSSTTYTNVKHSLLLSICFIATVNMKRSRFLKSPGENLSQNNAIANNSHR